MCKVCGKSYVVTFLKIIPFIEWCMALLVVENGHKNDTCYDEIGLHLCFRFNSSTRLEGRL